MATKWTDAQLSAINTRDKTLLVSAAAGSGKTATLTERIIRSLTDTENPADISRMLIVTFTRASAADLKVKISNALSKKLLDDPFNTHLTQQLVALGSAHISTIDSFYYDIVKSNFQKLSLPQTPRIADDAEIVPLNLSVIDEVIEDFYFSHNDFEGFMENFTSTRDNSKAGEIFLSMYDKLLSQRAGFDALKSYADDLEAAAEKDFFDTKYGAVALRQTTAFINYALAFAEDAYARISQVDEAEAKYGEAFSDDLIFLKKLKRLLDERSYTDISAELNDHTAITPPTLKGFPEFSKLRQIRKDNYASLEKIKKHYFRFSNEEIKISFEENARICRRLHELLREFDTRIMVEKTSRGICTFADIRRFVLDILCQKDGLPTDTAIEYRERFDYIYIDEYQDVDEVQDTIFKTISKPTNRFMVGDIKQSIYGFRNADPSIFAEYKNTLPSYGSGNSDAYALFMSNNFRCDESVIDFSNAISSFLFSNRAKSIGYTSDDDLIFSKDNGIENYSPVPSVVAITGIMPEGVKSTMLTDGEKEAAASSAARYIANEIKRLTDSEFLADEKDTAGNIIKRKITYGDIAILARKKARFPLLVKELEKLGIPTQCAKESAFFENPDVLLMLSFLSTIDNPQKDISLAGTLRSPFFGFTLDDILTIRMTSEPTFSLYDALVAYSHTDSSLGNKCKSFIESLNYWRDAAASTPCDKLIKKIYNELSVLSFGASDSKNLLRLYEYAIKFESNGFKGLYSFIKYVNELIESGVKLPDDTAKDVGNCVQIMTIHSSKGLEFPICFIFDCEKSFSTESAKEKIQFEPSVGIGFIPHDKSGFAKYDSPLLRSIIDNRLILETEEEMRLLYVAMTRARERLYVVAQLPHPETKLEKIKNICEYDKEYAVLGASSYIDWVFAALEYTDKKDCYRIEEHEIQLNSEDKINEPTPPEPFDDISDENNQKEIDISETLSLLKSRFDYKYPFEHISELPAKLSVSSLSPQVLDGTDTGNARLEDFDDNFEELFGKDFVIPESLHEASAASAAERGTATHAFLQFCDFKKAVSQGTEAEIARLCELRFISPKYAQIINKNQIDRFFKSKLYERISKAKKVWREQRFNIFLPAAEFTRDKEKAELLKDETIAVQGVIDIFFEDENGKIVLCDYKTDYLTKEELATPSIAAKKLNARHAEQLSYYAKAIEEMLGKAADEIIIYSLPLGEDIKVDFNGESL